MFFIARFKIRKLLFVLWELLYLIQFSFYAYFNSWIKSYDIKLFFTHINETLESFLPLISYFSIAIFVFIIILLFIVTNNFKAIVLNKWILIFVLIFTGTNAKINDVSILLIKEIPYSLNTKEVQLDKKIKQLSIIQDTNQSIVLVIGESHRAKEYLKDEMSFFKNNYTTIYSAATNTDVAIPLFINGIQDIKQLNTTNNLFKLAKKNNYHTQFISTQKKSYLKYILPYMEKKFIDNYKVLASQNDNDLIKEITNIDFSKKTFVILHMQGAHSPYKYHEEKQSDTIQEQYYKCYKKSNHVLDNIQKIVSNKAIFIFTSDHGENLGEDGKYGHNRFTPEVYKVPLVIYNNPTTQNIKSHYDLYLYIIKHLGYDTSSINNNKKIKVYGTMINGEDGFREFLR